MEFHNPKLLPRGMHEIIVAFMPSEVYDATRVIVYPREPYRYAPRGEVGYDAMTDAYRIQLYPSECAGSLYWGGTYSFELWMQLLSTALHEAGHLATMRFRRDYRHEATDYRGARDHYEALAEAWCHRALGRILRVDPRLGQPLGALTGYPGDALRRWHKWGLEHPSRTSPSIIRAVREDWRASTCDGQLTPQDIVKKIVPRHAYEGHFRAMRSRLYSAIEQAAAALRIERFYTGRTGRRYRLFNAGEAEAVYAWLCAKGWGVRACHLAGKVKR